MSVVLRDHSRDRVRKPPLWLCMLCAGHVQWSWDGSHLDFLERHVAADLRERTPNVNRSLASRLPCWIKSASRRDDVLRAICKRCAPLPGWALSEGRAAETAG